MISGTSFAPERFQTLILKQIVFEHLMFVPERTPIVFGSFEFVWIRTCKHISSAYDGYVVGLKNNTCLNCQTDEVLTTRS